MIKRNACPSDIDLLSALEGELSTERLEAVRLHLEACTACQTAYREMAALRACLLSRRRPDPPPLLLDRYRERLAACFPTHPYKAWIRISPLSSLSFRPLVAFAVMVIVFLTGLFLGRGLRHETPPPPPRLTEADRRFLTDFFLQSEIWILDTAGLVDRPALPEEWRMNQDLASRLLVKSAAVSRKLTPFPHTTALEVLDRLEVLLLEATESGDPAVKNTFQVLHGELLRNLLREIREVQGLLTPPQHEGV